MELFSLTQDFVRQHSAVFSPSFRFLKDEPLADHSTIRIGGRADLMVFPRDVFQLSLLLRFYSEKGVRILPLGKGSNTLFVKDRFPGVILSMKELRGRSRSKNRLLFGAGATLSSACHFACECGLSGMEELYGIPGTLGGAVVMNAGAFGRSIADLSPTVYYVDALDGKPYTLPVDSCGFGYRESIFLNDSPKIVFAVSVRLFPESPALIATQMRRYAEERREKQPLSLPSLGSVFKRPKTGYAARYIEEAGLKGYTVGGASVSEKHAGFIVNNGDATAKDVLEIIEKIKAEVFSRFSVVLEPEIRIVR